MSFFTRLARMLGVSRARSRPAGPRPDIPDRPQKTRPLAAKPVLMDPKEILFSLPTINDALPVQTSGRRPSIDTVLIHEDDWRQFEFVSSIHREALDEELKDIDQIWKTQSVGTGEFNAFRTLHVRKRIGVPLVLDFTEADFTALFGKLAGSFGFLQHPQTLKDVIACQSGGFAFYAHILERKLVTLGVSKNGNPTLDAETAARLEQFMTVNELLLVHWPGRTLFESPAAVANFLRGVKPPSM